MRCLGTASSASQAAERRMPRNRPPPAAIWASSTSPTALPRRRLAVPTIPAASRVGPYRPEALIAAIPFTNSVSPTGRRASGRIPPVHGSTLDEDRGRHVVAAADVFEDFVEQVARGDAAGHLIPQVVVRIADRQGGLERLLDCQLEPLVIRLRCRHGERAPSPASPLAGGAPPRDMMRHGPADGKRRSGLQRSGLQVVAQHLVRAMQAAQLRVDELIQFAGQRGHGHRLVHAASALHRRGQVLEPMEGGRADSPREGWRSPGSAASGCRRCRRTGCGRAGRGALPPVGPWRRPRRWRGGPRR